MQSSNALKNWTLLHFPKWNGLKPDGVDAPFLFVFTSEADLPRKDRIYEGCNEDIGRISLDKQIASSIMVSSTSLPILFPTAVLLYRKRDLSISQKDLQQLLLTEKYLQKPRCSFQRWMQLKSPKTNDKCIH